MLKIISVITSLVDYPEHVCSTIFTIDCNLRCPFCYNWKLFLEYSPNSISCFSVLQILRSRKRLTKYITITGGEPTIHDDLPSFCKMLHEEGFKIKLDTNGLLPDIVEQCLPYLSYIAMDIKTSPEKYQAFCKNTLSFPFRENLLRTISLIQNSPISYEFRTTLVPGIVTLNDLKEIMTLFSKPVKKYVFQQFRPEETYSKELRKIEPYSIDYIKNMIAILKIKNLYFIY